MRKLRRSYPALGIVAMTGNSPGGFEEPFVRAGAPGTPWKRPI